MKSSIRVGIISVIIATAVLAVAVIVFIIFVLNPGSNRNKKGSDADSPEDNGETTPSGVQSTTLDIMTSGEPTLPAWLRPQTESSSEPELNVALLYGALGPVMVLHEQQWGFICGNDFMFNADGCGVVCFELGYRYGQPVSGCSTDHAQFDHIWLDHVNCRGDESHLADCPHAEWGQYDCDLSELASCKCCDTTSTCDVGVNYECPTRMECPSGDQMRILSTDTMCDENWDCEAGEDESCAVCMGNEAPVRCSATGTCILTGWLCDGIADCASGEDESEQVCPLSCGSDGFMCHNHSCIPLSQRCDFRYDCGDHSDELNCFRARDTDTGEVPLLYNPILSEYVPICSEHFDDVTADDLCMSLGFGESTTVSIIGSSSVPESTSGFSIIRVTTLNNSVESNNVYGSSSWNAEYISAPVGCLNNEVVQLSCSFEQCGTRHRSFTDNLYHIIDGEDAHRGMWPWQARLRIVVSDQERACGAVLINDQWALTVMQCITENFQDATSSYVRLGSLQENQGGIVRQVQRIIPHPEYSAEASANDLALLQLEEPIDEHSSLIRPVCLPDESYDPYDPSVLECYVTGWGINEEFIIPDMLQQLRVDITDEVFPEVVCARNDVLCFYTPVGRSVCRGDIGGPLVCRNRDNVWTLLGVITSHGDCFGVTGVTLVAHHLDWIYDTIA